MVMTSTVIIIIVIVAIPVRSFPLAAEEQIRPEVLLATATVPGHCLVQPTRDSYTSVTPTGHLYASFAVHREHICGVLGQSDWSGTGQEIGGRCCGVVLHSHPLELSLSPGTRRTRRTEGFV